MDANIELMDMLRVVHLEPVSFITKTVADDSVAPVIMPDRFAI